MTKWPVQGPKQFPQHEERKTDIIDMYCFVFLYKYLSKHVEQHNKRRKKDATDIYN